MIAPPHESKEASERDFAGADLTAWAYDMFNPLTPYAVRDSFPDGEGVNRRIGFSELSPEAQSYLKKQKNLSLLNFLNPAIFFVNRIKLNDNFSFNFFTQYAPTHFGNDLALYIPMKYKQYDLLLNLHSYTNRTGTGFGIGAGLYNYKLNDKWESDISLDFWNQPKSFFDNSLLFGGQINLLAKYQLNKNFSAFAGISAKSRGWIISNPYLRENYSLQFGLNYNLRKG